MKNIADRIIRTGVIPKDLGELTDAEFDDLMLYLWEAYHEKERHYHKVRLDRRVKEGIGNFIRRRDI